MEIWKEAAGLEGAYEVSNLGRVKSVKLKDGPQGRIIKPTDNGNGYLVFSVTTPKDYPGGHFRKKMHVHQLVVRTFHGPKLPGMVCRHLDGNPTNNRASNLKWGTYKENTHDMYRHGTIKLGEDCLHAKLMPEDIFEIRKRIASGEPQRSISQDFGIHQVTVSEIKTGKIWKHI